MKRILLTLTLLLGVGTMAFAQKGTTEVSAFAGGISFNDLLNKQGSKFATNFGGGLQLKHNVSDIVYLVTELNGGWDGEKSYFTESPKAGVEVKLRQKRQDFNFTAGVGANFLRAERWTGYIHAMIGVGTRQATREYLDIPNNPYSQIKQDISLTACAVSSSVGFDYLIGSDWKVGLYYTNRLLKVDDLSHMYGLKVSFVLPK